MLRAIRMCLRPNVDNGNNTTRPLVSLGFALGTNFTSSIIPLIYYTKVHAPNDQDILLCVKFPVMEHVHLEIRKKCAA